MSHFMLVKVQSIKILTATEFASYYSGPADHVYPVPMIRRLDKNTEIIQ